MPLIFVNYRTNDEEATATLVDRELSRVFGNDNVFRASKSIGLGSQFPQELLTAVRRSSVLLAVMGPRWLQLRDPDGQSPLEDENDWTRREIREALETGAVVIPLLVGGAERLRSEDLPEDVEVLASCQYRRLSHRNADADLMGLADDLVELLPELGAAARSNGYRPRAAMSVDDRDGMTDGAGDTRVRASVIKHRQRGGIGNLNGDFSGTFVSEPQGPVHTGSGHLYEAREQYLAPRISGDGSHVQYVGENHGEVRQRANRNVRPLSEER
ncbi:MULTISPECIES: toll/interleukin-1 receptor domain-containing protein [unclassified Streptomyces]|uniref:toll/interleukin-1 receptor domain-containing protein n=1 Tax=unclassified Streptomyces TaxID=2593676 RepID=UPI0003799CEB|nr:toll/interleukin-1 receptor domain-containing protein [Streptomyces sp. LaPpAH-202]MYW56591.1 TIR domain-containing protein [Streptomyces sp. SID8370]MYW83612.1 TIR domain-containing protein [Streptomyces sp. SID8371]